jgi:hypothetical protein
MKRYIYIILNIITCVIMIFLFMFFEKKFQFNFNVSDDYIFSYYKDAFNKYWKSIITAPILENLILIILVNVIFKFIKNINYRIVFTSSVIFLLSIFTHSIIDGRIEYFHGFSFLLYYFIYLFYNKSHGKYVAFAICYLVHALSNVTKLLIFPFLII